MKRSIVFLGVLALVVPLLFMGCSGDDGATGATGATGPPGPAGAPGTGVAANETCVLCHAAGGIKVVSDVHRLDGTTGNPLSPGSASITVNSVVFGAPSGDNVPVTVNFTFVATSAKGDDITGDIDLTTKSGTGANDNLAFVGFSLAKLVPGQTFPTGGKDADEWNGFVVNPGTSGSGPYRTNVPHGVNGVVFTGTPADGVYSYRFPDNAVRISDGYDNTALMRVGIQFSVGNPSAVNTPVLDAFTTDPYYQTFPRANRRRPVANAWLDRVPPAGGVGTGVAPTPGQFPNKVDVSTAACNACHDPLAIHGGGRREYQFCQICHNEKTEREGNRFGGGWDNTNLVKLVHRLHGRNPQTDEKLSLGAEFEFLGEEITYPQDIRNCTKCHQGPANEFVPDNTYANWQLRPTRTACGSCHVDTNFDTGVNHGGGVQATNQACFFCHGPEYIADIHATENRTPNNPQLPLTTHPPGKVPITPALVSFEYGIDNVTVDNTGLAEIKFWIKQDGAFVNLNRLGDNTITRPLGTAGSPAFLFAYALPQDGVDNPEDYNNRGAVNLTGSNAGQLVGYGQPASRSIVGMAIVDNVGTSQYTVRQPNAFPPGAQMRAVALQAYFTQMLTVDYNNDGTVDFKDNVGRHTFSVARGAYDLTLEKADRTRRVAVESGYTNNNNPITGTPVGCLECHEIFEGHGGNRVSNAQVCVMCHNPNMTSSARTFRAGELTNPDIIAGFGTDPLKFPEVANGFKELIHGLHGRDKRTTNFVDIRNRVGGVLIQGDEITFPGEPSHCGKCHLNNLYQQIQTTGRLPSTASITTGADNTVEHVRNARTIMPNATDLVNSPATSACGHCHDSDLAKSHFLTQGGAIRSPRGTETVELPLLFPVTP